MQARAKLEEARYFLEEMRRVKDNPTSFRYELSAFLAAARSVDYYLRTAAKTDPALQAWHQGVKAEIIHGYYAEIKFFIDQRNFDIHAVPVAPQSWAYLQYEVTFDDEGLVPVSAIRLGKGDGSQADTVQASPVDAAEPVSPSFSIQGPVVINTYEFTTRPHQDVFVICLHYLDELEQILTEAEQKFPHL